jgi:hypothetical protein
MDKEKKNRCITCTDEEWDHIKKAAATVRLPISQFIVNSALKDEVLGNIDDHLHRIRTVTRLLAIIQKKQFEDEGRGAEFDQLWEEAKDVPD